MMKRKEIWKKLSWALAAGLVISNPAHLNAKEMESETEEHTIQTEPETESDTEPVTESEAAETETQSPMTETQSPETETATEQITEPVTESETETQSERESRAAETEEEKRKKPVPQTEAQPKTDSQSQPESQSQSPERSESSSQADSGNALLIAGQSLYQVEKIEEDFRFVTVEEEPAVARENLKIYEEMSETARAVGTLPEDGICYVLKEDGDWIFVESGVVRGFVKADSLLCGDQAKQKMAASQGEGDTISLAFPVRQLKKSSSGESDPFAAYAVSVDYLEEAEYTEDWNQPGFAEPLVDPVENQAIAYTRTTTRETVVSKIYAVAKEQITIYASVDPEGKEQAGVLEKGGLCYILADEKSDRIYVESGDVRGFVDADKLTTGKEAREIVEEKGEAKLPTAEKKLEPEENPALYYTLTSTKEGKIGSAIRTSMVKFATSFVGNPYVWGGTSLTQGADCSGFVQSVYAQYGYSIPRVAADQAQYGTKIRVSDAQPGDLIFYAKDGEIYHVVMYIGDGKVVEAAGTGLGILVSNLNTSGAVWATSIITDSDEEVIRRVNQKTAVYEKADEEDIGELLGKFKLTSYCTCAVCCGQWANGVTASGAMPAEGRTVAMAGVPFGTRLVINGQIYVVEDRGTPYGHVDIFQNVHEECEQFGVQYAEVYLAK